MRHSVSVLCALLLAVPAAAVSPVTVEHSTEADFATGTAVGVVLTSEGRLKLGRELAVRMTSAQAPAVVSALAVDGRTIYVASGSDNTIHKIAADGTVAPFATVEGTIVTSLLWTGTELLAGTSGATGAGVYRVDAQGVVTPVWSDENVQYIWTILRGAAGKLYVATGPKARVYVIDGGVGEVLYEATPAQAKNILCLVLDTDGTLYAGTDTTGLVVHIDPVKKTGRVVLSATEKEVSALVLDGKGGLYAATSDASRAAGESAARGPGGAAFGGPAVRGVAVPTGGAVGPTSAPATMPASAPAGELTSAPTTVPTSMPAGGPGAMTAPVGVPGPVVAVAQPAVPAQAVPPTPAPAPRPAALPVGLRGPVGPATSPSVDGPGNAVYYIDPDGLVRAIFRYPVSMYAMIRVGDALVLGTGNNGQIFRIDLVRDEIVMLANAESSQITALAVSGGEVVFGTSNKGAVGVIGATHAKTGTFTSKAIDAQQIARWGTVRVRAAGPENTGVTISTRTGNVAEPDDATWSEWSEPAEAKNGFIKIANPAGRFFQYRLAFAGDGTATPAAGDVRVVYQVGNLAPVISAVQIVGGESGPAGGPQAGGPPRPMPGAGDASPTAVRGIAIQASDPNGDTLVYKIEVREAGTDEWVTIAEKLDKPVYVWDTNTVGDGDYELRVTASDAPANPPDQALTAVKVTKTVRVDNTPPVVKDLAAQVVEGGDGAVSIQASGVAVDASRIAAIHYSLNSATDWVAVSPDSGLCADTEESFAFTVKNVKPGKYRLTVRATDAIGNTGFASVTVNVGG